MMQFLTFRICSLERACEYQVIMVLTCRFMHVDAWLKLFNGVCSRPIIITLCQESSLF